MSDSSSPSSAASAAGYVRDAIRDIIAGTIGGIAGRVIEYPFDTVKTKLQAASIGLSRGYNGAMDCFLRTLKDEGIAGLYRGMAAPLAATVVETSTLFFTNGFMKRMLRERGHIEDGDELPMPLVYVAGAGTGFFVSFVLTPIELVKCRLQVATDSVSTGTAVSSAPRYKGPWDCFVKSIQREGLAVVFRGHTATMLREIPGTACWFGAYEAFARWMTPPGAKREDLSSMTIIAAGAFGGVAYWAIMYPADTIKSAMQIAEGPEPVVSVAPGTAGGGTGAAAVQVGASGSGGSGSGSSGNATGGTSGAANGETGTHGRNAASASGSRITSGATLRQALRGLGQAGARSATTPLASLAHVSRASTAILASQAHAQAGGRGVGSAATPSNVIASASASGLWGQHGRHHRPLALHTGGIVAGSTSAGGIGSGAMSRALGGVRTLVSGPGRPAPVPVSVSGSAHVTRQLMQGMGLRLSSSSSSSAPAAAGSATAVAASASASVASVASVPASAFDPSFMGTLRSIYRSAGMRGLYAGFWPTLLRAAPSNAAIFVCYEWANAQMKPYI